MPDGRNGEVRYIFTRRNTSLQNRLYPLGMLLTQIDAHVLAMAGLGLGLAAVALVGAMVGVDLRRRRGRH